MRARADAIGGDNVEKGKFEGSPCTCGCVECGYFGDFVFRNDNWLLNSSAVIIRVLSGSLSGQVLQTNVRLCAEIFRYREEY